MAEEKAEDKPTKPILVENVEGFAVMSGESVLKRTYVEPFDEGIWVVYSSESYKLLIGLSEDKQKALGKAYEHLRNQYKDDEIVDSTSRAKEGNLVAKTQ